MEPPVHRAFAMREPIVIWVLWTLLALPLPLAAQTPADLLSVPGTEAAGEEEAAPEEEPLPGVHEVVPRFLDLAEEAEQEEPARTCAPVPHKLLSSSSVGSSRGLSSCGMTGGSKRHWQQSRSSSFGFSHVQPSHVTPDSRQKSTLGVAFR